MCYVGIDLHKKTISLCVVNQQRQVLCRATLPCSDRQGVLRFFSRLGPFEAVVEATASYEWLWQLLEPLAQRLVLAHPKKLRVIAESTRKSDRVDAQVLAEFLALDMIPQAYRPTPRQRQHRALVRQREAIRRRGTALKNKIRRLASDYNADRRDLFTSDGMTHLEQVAWSDADRFVLRQLLDSLEHTEEQLHAIDKELKAFAKKAPVAEQEARAILHTIPEVGAVTVDVVISEIGDIKRFRSNKPVVSFAGLAPGLRESAGKRKELGITKEGSRRLRWVLVEAAWRLVRRCQRWRSRMEALQHRKGKKKAIVAIARRLLVVMASMWRKGEAYRFAA